MTGFRFDLISPIDHGTSLREIYAANVGDPESALEAVHRKVDVLPHQRLVFYPSTAVIAATFESYSIPAGEAGKVLTEVVTNDQLRNEGLL